MIKTIFYCDSCGNKLNTSDYSRYTVKAHEHVQATGTPTAEIFCPKCLEQADEYWRAKAELVQGLVLEVAKRIERHRKEFFHRRNTLHVVKPTEERVQ